MTLRVRAEMPEATPRIPRERYWWIPAVGFAVLCAAMFAWAWRIALHPNGYAGHRFRTEQMEGGLGEWVFPMDSMISIAQAMAVELAIITIVCAWRARSSVASRALVLCGLVVGFMILAAVPLIMHASAPYPQFLFLQFLGAAWLLLFGLVSKGLARLRPVR